MSKIINVEYEDKGHDRIVIVILDEPIPNSPFSSTVRYKATVPKSTIKSKAFDVGQYLVNSFTKAFKLVQEPDIITEYWAEKIKEALSA